MAVSIRLASDSESERRLKRKLSKVLARSEALRRWQFTNKIVIDEGIFSHSHPVLTIGARSRGVKTEAGLLSVYVHEQIHWFLSGHPVLLRCALRDLRKEYPHVRVGTKDGGARDEKSTYLHLLVCTLEYEALRTMIGKTAASRLLSSRPYYGWIYKTVLRNFDVLLALCALHRLVP